MALERLGRASGRWESFGAAQALLAASQLVLVAGLGRTCASVWAVRSTYGPMRSVVC